MAASISNLSIDPALDFDHFITPWNERVSCLILFGVINVLGVCTNGCAVGLSLFTDLRKKKVNLLIANLASSDLLLPVVFFATQHMYILNREYYPEFGCALTGFNNFLAAMQEFAFPPVLAINRYVSLYKSHSYDRIYTPLNMILMIAGTWSFSTGVCLMFLLTGHTGYDHRNEHCCVVVEEDKIWSIVYWVAVIVPCVAITDTTMVFCNWKIYKKLKGHATTTGSLLKNNVVKENSEILHFLIIDMLMPICAHSVYHVSKFAVTDRFPLWSRQFFTCLYYGNAALRGGVILVMLRPYRMAFKQHILRVNPNEVTPTTSGDGTAATRAVTVGSRTQHAQNQELPGDIANK